MDDCAGKRMRQKQRRREIGCFTGAHNKPAAIDKGSMKIRDCRVDMIWGKIDEDIATENDIHVVGVIDERRIRAFHEIQL